VVSSQRLAAVDRVVGRVDVEDDPGRRLAARADEGFHQELVEDAEAVGAGPVHLGEGGAGRLGQGRVAAGGGETEGGGGWLGGGGGGRGPGSGTGGRCAAGRRRCSRGSRPGSGRPAGPGSLRRGA